MNERVTPGLCSYYFSARFQKLAAPFSFFHSSAKQSWSFQALPPTRRAKKKIFRKLAK